MKDISEYIEKNFLLPNGYLNMKMFIDCEYTFIVVIGPRGTGKTFGVYSECVKNGMKMFSVRRKKKQYDLTANPLTTPIKKPLKHIGVDFRIETVEDGLSVVYNNANDELLMHITYVDNIRDMRGIDSDDLSIMLLDEGVPEHRERKKNGEGFALLQAYETLNRNREFELGVRPLKFIMLANYDDAASDIFVELRIVSELYRLPPSKCKCFPKRNLLIFNTGETPISMMKSESALYNLVGKDSDLYKINIKNMSPTKFNEVLSVPLKKLRLRFTIGELAIYWYVDKGVYYVSRNTYNTESYNLNDINKLKYTERGFIYDLMLNRVVYESEFLESVLKKYLKF